MPAKVDVERIMAEIRRGGRTRRRTGTELPIEPPLSGEATKLHQLLDESVACVDLYETKGMAPGRLWVPWPIRPFLIALLRYFLNWQTHWNGVVSRALAELLRLVERIERRLGESLAASVSRVAGLEQRVADLDGRREVVTRRYLDFEALHRGDEAEIRARLSVHGERLQRMIAGDSSLLEGGAVVVDLGCGRGEMLEILRARGVPSRGVDSNPDMVRACQDKGLDVVPSDLFDWLEAAPPRSLAGAISCQVIEHLSFDELLELVARLSQALRPGAPCILETVNPENLIVAAHTFHLDPSHRLKLPAPTLSHLLRSFGFEVLDVAYLNACPPEEQLRMLPGEGTPLEATLNGNLLRLNHLLFGPRDYAVACRLPLAGAAPR